MAILRVCVCVHDSAEELEAELATSLTFADVVPRLTWLGLSGQLLNASNDSDQLHVRGVEWT